MATSRDDQIRAAVANLLDVFRQPEHFRFEGIIGSGAHGVTIKVTELRPARIPMPMLAGQKRKRARTITPTEMAHALRGVLSAMTGAVRRLGRAARNPGVPDRERAGSPPDRGMAPRRTIVLKRPIGPDGERLLRSEFDILQSVAGSMHIVRALAYRDGPRLTIPIGGVLGGNGGPVVGPVLAMEYLENGSFVSFVKRLQARWQPIPNRVLWSIYLCGVRAVTALAYPTAYDPDEPQRLEQVPDPDIRPSLWMHGDLHMDNIMFGLEDASVREHRYVPIMKMIDFGRCREHPDAIQENLYDITEIIYNMICRQTHNPYRHTRSAAYQYEVRPATPYAPAEYKTIQTWAVLLSDEVEMNIHLDTELRALICQSMATNHNDRPALRDVLFQVSRAASSRTAVSFLLNRTQERDEDIEQFIQDTIYNAEPHAPPLPSAELRPQVGFLGGGVEVVSLIDS